MSSVLAISVGAAVGAILRWALSVAFNAWILWMPPGTLAANLLGGYLIGIAIAVFDRNTALPPQWRLGIVTGFLGGLTTFSSFSGEVFGELHRHGYLRAAGAVFAHLGGSVALTLLGMATVARLAPSKPAEDEPGEALERFAGE